MGIDLNIDEIEKHPYQQENYLPLFKPGWERREKQNGLLASENGPGPRTTVSAL